MGNSCMGVHCIACQIREPTTSDKTGLDQGQIHSTRWPIMTEPDTLKQATSLQKASRASKRNMDCHVRGLIRGVRFSVSCNLNDKAFLGWLVQA